MTFLSVIYTPKSDNACSGKSVCKGALPQMRRYVQSHTIESPVNDAIRAGRGSGEAFDGITEVWFDSLESMGASTGEEAAVAARRLFEDESRFIDFAASSVFVTEEHEIF